MQDHRRTPGARISGFWLGNERSSPENGSTSEPDAVSLHGFPSFPCAPTEITPSILAGVETSELLESSSAFPAAATTKIPSPRASFTASIVSDDDGAHDPGSLPRLREIISAFCEILHHLIAWETILSFVDLPDGPNAIATDNETPGAAPMKESFETRRPVIKVPWLS